MNKIYCSECGEMYRKGFVEGFTSANEVIAKLSLPITPPPITVSYDCLLDELKEEIKSSLNKNRDLISRKAVVEMLSKSLQKGELSENFWDDEQTPVDFYNSGIQVAIGKIQSMPGETEARG